MALPVGTHGAEVTVCRHGTPVNERSPMQVLQGAVSTAALIAVARMAFMLQNRLASQCAPSSPAECVVFRPRTPPSTMLGESCYTSHMMSGASTGIAKFQGG